jgi:hypothetical protein
MTTIQGLDRLGYVFQTAERLNIEEQERKPARPTFIFGLEDFQWSLFCPDDQI